MMPSCCILLTDFRSVVRGQMPGVNFGRTNALSQFLVGQMPGGQMSGANFWSEQMPRVNFGPDK